MSVSKAIGQWEGNLKQGRGNMKPAHGGDVPFGLATRFEGAAGSNPEEMIGAALSGCFSMALAAALEKAGGRPSLVRTEAAVSLEKEGAGFVISKIDLTTTATVADIDAAKFELIAQETKESCPVAKALLGTRVSLTARLG